MSEISEKKALEAYPVIPSPYYDGDEDRNLKYRFGFIKGYEQAIKDKSIEWSEFDNDMMNAIICLTKQGRCLEEEHLNWIKNFINKLHNE